MHKIKRSLALFSIKSLINSPSWTHRVKGVMFFYFSHIYVFFLAFVLPTPETALTFVPPPPATTANAVDMTTNTLLCWISHVQGSNYFLLRTHPHPPRSGPVPTPEKRKPNCGKSGRRKMERSQASSRNHTLPTHTLVHPPLSPQPGKASGSADAARGRG